jgi:hypothetical protein
MTKQAADDRSKPNELSEQQLDNVVGGTKKIDKASAVVRHRRTPNDRHARLLSEQFCPARAAAS